MVCQPCNPKMNWLPCPLGPLAAIFRFDLVDNGTIFRFDLVDNGTEGPSQLSSKEFVFGILRRLGHCGTPEKTNCQKIQPPKIDGFPSRR